MCGFILFIFLKQFQGGALSKTKFLYLCNAFFGDCIDGFMFLRSGSRADQSANPFVYTFACIFF